MPDRRYGEGHGDTPSQQDEAMAARRNQGESPGNIVSDGSVEHDSTRDKHERCG